MDIGDVWVALTALAFFSLCVAFVKGCDRIIGPDSADDLTDPEALEVQPADSGVV